MAFRSNSIPNDFFDVSCPPDGFSGGDFFFGFLIEFFYDAFHRLRRDSVFLESIIGDNLRGTQHEDLVLENDSEVGSPGHTGKSPAQIFSDFRGRQ